MKAADFVKYVQLVSSTRITLSGKRWNSGLTETVKDQSVLGTWKVEVNAVRSLKPSAWKAETNKTSMITLMAVNKIRATKLFGGVHLTLRGLCCVSAGVNYCFSIGFVSSTRDDYGLFLSICVKHGGT